jgi:hypothetical protein
LDISDAESVGRLLVQIDKSNGYVFLESTDRSNNNSFNGNLFRSAAVPTSSDLYETIADIRERIASPESIRELSMDHANNTSL